MADLPKERITPDEPPFTNVGVDFFGPFEVKRGRSTVWKETVWIHLYLSKYQGSSH